MISHRARSGLAGLGILVNAGTAVGLTDGQLLECFATRGGDAAELAFATLVDRHGSMILRTCRAILQDEHAAWDAFQATFVILGRRGGSLWVRDSIGPWLHRVARHAAIRARRGEARRRTIERVAAPAAERPRTSRATMTQWPSSTRSSIGSPSDIASRWCSATSKVAPTRTPRGISAAPWGRLRAAYRGRGSDFATA
jgi:hypothetical protein